MIDTFVRHQAYLQQYANGDVKRALKLLKKTSKELQEKIAAHLATDFQLQRAKEMESEIRAVISQLTAEVKADVDFSSAELAEYETRFTGRTLATMTTVEMASVPINQIMGAITNTPMVLRGGQVVRSLTPAEMFLEFAGTAGRDVWQTVQSGSILGRTTQDIIRDVRMLVNGRTRSQVETVVRTSLAHAASVANQEWAKANTDILVGERFSATLDGRTSIFCAANDGKVFPVGEGPIPPCHHRCRSRRVSVVNPKLSVPGMKMERASMNGPVDAKETYGTWLKRQPVDFQNDVLGKTRAELFRTGKVPIDRFVNDSGRTLTLKELAIKEGLE